MRLLKPLRAVALFMIFVSGGFVVALAQVAAVGQRALVSGLTVTQATTVVSGRYALADRSAGVVRVTGHDFVIDFRGARLTGPRRGDGIGIHVVDARNVTIRNAVVTGYRWGVVVERSVGVKLVGCIVSANADLPAGTVIDESGREPEDQHGGGILIRDSADGRVEHCTARDQWDGIDVVRSSGWVIEDGDFSYNGNWGLHLWNSSHNTFRRNRAVWCTTGEGRLYQALTGWQTYDAQAVGIDHNSNENLIEGNDLRFGGDGIFIRANEGPLAPGTVVPPRNGSNRNVLRNNDCSFSPNNAIEVDLVDDTVIEGNNCSNSHYGMWLGYSRGCVVRRNTCIDDTAHAVEIENGQNDLFENNVFGNTVPRADSQLIYLRQNGRDKTPSTGYVLRGNLFYGAPVGVQLRATGATLIDNVMSWRGIDTAKLVGGDVNGLFVRDGTYDLEQGSIYTYLPTSAEHPVIVAAGQPDRIMAGQDFTVKYNTKVSIVGTINTVRLWRMTSQLPPVVTIDGIPVWVKSTTGGRATCYLPDDLWDRPGRDTLDVSIVSNLFGERWHARAVWPAGKPRIDGVTPNPARIGDRLTITGVGLQGGRLLLNGASAAIERQAPNRLVARLPGGILVSKRYNLVYERGSGVDLVRTWPITVAVDVPPAQMPHLVTARFSPTTLRVGELLHVEFTVRNNLPTAAPLTTVPAPPFVYDEAQAWNEVGIAEQPGTLQLRVTSDHPGGHEPGSWPYLFGFAAPRLGAGETVKVTGAIRVRTAGTHEFRVGLVNAGGRFIDDNAFRTRITVRP
jgi:parallel beta-helix repeat protein